MIIQSLDFEQPIAELEAKIDALRKVENASEVSISEEITKLEEKSRKLTDSIFSSLSDWQIIQLARHPGRPYSLDYINAVYDEFEELHGDRCFADDPAIVAGVAKLGKQPVMVIGQQKGRTTKEKLHRNFGMPHPEGYRRALRLMKMAEQFKLPVVTLIDTPGAYPGVNAEARGQSEAIAANLEAMAGLKVPIVCMVIGEGCSGGALGIGVGDRLLMLQYSYFATISPEGCASILWKNADKAPQAAEIMGITAKRLQELKIVDRVVPEPVGGAHRNHAEVAESLKQAILEELDNLQQLSTEELLNARYHKLQSFGEFETLK